MALESKLCTRLNVRTYRNQKVFIRRAHNSIHSANGISSINQLDGRFALQSIGVINDVGHAFVLITQFGNLVDKIGYARCKTRSRCNDGQDSCMILVQERFHGFQIGNDFISIYSSRNDYTLEARRLNCLETTLLVNATPQDHISLFIHLLPECTQDE